MTSRFLLILFALLIFISCKEETDPTPNNTFKPGEGVFTLCEGVFQQGNARLDFYNFNTKLLSEETYKSRNSEPLGDILNSMLIIDQEAYLTVNNSGKILIAKADDLTKTDEISGLVSPRYFFPIDDTKAYITDLFSGEISIYDMNTLQKTGSIKGRNWDEQMVMIGDILYVAEAGSGQVLSIDTNTDIVIDSIYVGDHPQRLLVDKDQKIWVHCLANYYEPTHGGLYRIDPSTMEVISSFPHESSSNFNTSIALNGAKSTIYYLNKDVFSMNIESQQAPEIPDIEANGRSIYAIGVDPVSDEIYISDAVDFNSNGTIYRYDINGLQIDSLTTGKIPGSFYFY